MNQEVEIKVIVKNYKGVVKKILRIGKFVKERKQTDKYFTPLNDNYFTKNPTTEYLRIRREAGKNHLNYSFCHFSHDGSLSTTDEYEVVIEDPKIAEELLNKIGMRLRVTVSKIRKYFTIEGFEVTLDYIKELGYFLEIEAKSDFGGIKATKKACFDLLEKLGIEYEKCPNMGYPDMILAN